jgi:hypothetical protein
VWGCRTESNLAADDRLIENTEEVWRVIQTTAASRAKTALHWRYRLYMLNKQDIGYLFQSTSGSEHGVQPRRAHMAYYTCSFVSPQP